MAVKKIYFMASFGPFDKLPLGGGQTAARRLLSVLKKLGYDVVAIHRHPPTAKSNMIRGIQFSFWMLLDPILVFFRLAFQSRKNAITLYMGYMGSVLIPLECIMSWLTHVLGYRNVMYLAGGGTEKVYKNCNAVLRYFERKILDGYSLVMTEGYENMAFVRSISSTKVDYLPNFTEDSFAASNYPQKPHDSWNFMYFGRINETKNVLLGIEIFDTLSEKYDNMYYSIIGGGTDSYCKLVEERIAASSHRDRITRIGRSSHDVLKQMMKDQHFFLFPSNEPREGHSNALNEAMSFGLVPIVSDNNFLPSIVGNDRLVVHEMNAKAYASVIENVINSGDYEKLSHEMYERVRNNFTQSVIEKNLKKIIESL